jgi:RNA recognition motif-containing protein
LSCFGGDFAPFSFSGQTPAQSVPEQLREERHAFFVLRGNMPMNIYVGNLPFSATEDDLRSLFADYGDITSAAVITDRDTGQSRGFGFIELSDQARAGDAIGKLNGYDWDGRQLTVNEARPRQARN